MHLSIHTYGTRGDVQPFIALAVGLQKAGHTVQLAAPARLEPLAREHGIPFTPLPGDPAEFVRKLTDEAGGNPFKVMRVVLDFAIPLAGEIFQALRTASQGADGIIHSFLLVTGSHALARQLGIPDISAQLFPVFADSGAFASLMFPELPLGPLYNRFSHALFQFFFWNLAHASYPWVQRRQPSLPPKIEWPFAGPQPTPRLFALSPLLLPPLPDWRPDMHLTGFWFLDSDPNWQPPVELSDFLANGPPPVCITFSSLVSADGARQYAILRDSLRQTGQRAILLTGWSGWQTDDLPPNVLALPAAPHDWLFPRLSGVAHHGGAGTTAAALRAGIPSFIVPFSADQPFWARRVARLGVGPPPIPGAQLSVRRLAANLGALTSDPAARQRAAAIGAQIRAEDGVGRAVQLIERYFGPATSKTETTRPAG